MDCAVIEYAVPGERSDLRGCLLRRLAKWRVMGTDVEDPVCDPLDIAACRARSGSLAA